MLSFCYLSFRSSCSCDQRPRNYHAFDLTRPFVEWRCERVARVARDADRLRRDTDAAAVESREREREALADIAEHRSGPDPRIFEHDAARVGRTKTHLRFGLADREAHRLGGHDERGDARVRASGLRR